MVEGRDPRRPEDPSRDPDRDPDIARSRERERQVAEAKGHTRSTGVTSTAGGPVIEHTGFRLSWGAIFAGLVVAMVTQMMLSLLGLAIGLTAWDPGDPARGFGMGAAIWVSVAALISLFAGGVVTGRLAGVLSVGDGALHGGVMWGLSILVTVWLTAAGVGMVMGGAFQLVGTAAGATAGMVGEDAAAVGMEALVRNDRDAVIQGIAERTGLSRAETERIVGDVESQVRGTRVDTAQVRGTAEDIAGGVATGAWWALLAMLLSGGAAAGGAAMTARD